LPLVAERNDEQRLFGTTINAYRAHIQAEAENTDFCILSSLLAVLVNEKDKSSGNIGTFEEHLVAAVRIINWRPKK
jgi:hypothetical protein